ncbi:methyltransferase domain-containing protein [Maritimibacter dapengensis]|uniref:Class I SAM-dependent methyltransferase n=1 Tax=Maritimibacter dapengensis TaxID=2836868 RepID=A0ABS6T1N6_9RHOB|nr:methyltransferase domain-containing protein [Maritimibacter dapengensis]MBV7379153.1 class I SAM-dependent methyltransferase [Maritimibacter dapengensis]
MGRDAKAGQVSGSAAEIYDAFFVPALFGAWAGQLCDAAGVSSGEKVLDVACGTGATAREALAQVGARGHVTGLDRNDGMLAVAAARTPDVDWVEGMAEDLPFEDACFDRVLCQFGLMFFDDRAAALREMRRVLRPGGRLGLSVWDRAEASPGYARMIGLIGDMFGAEAADALRAPFVLGDRDALRRVLADGRLGDARVETVAGEARFSSIREWVRMDVRGWTLSDLIDDAGFEALVAAAEGACADFVGDGGVVRFAAPAHLVTWPGR